MGKVDVEYTPCGERNSNPIIKYQYTKRLISDIAIIIISLYQGVSCDPHLPSIRSIFLDIFRIFSFVRHGQSAASGS